MRTSILFFLVASAVLLGGLMIAGEPQEKEQPKHAEGHGQHMMHEGAIGYSGDGENYKTTVLGGIVGTESVNDVKVGVYVLQAESPERLKPDGSGPTHIFNLTFADETKEELLHDAGGTVVVTGTDGRRLRQKIQPFQSHFQVRVRLDQPGDYLVQVEFEAGGKSGSTKPIPFAYRWKGEEVEHDEHGGHGSHDGHGSSGH